MRVLLSSTSSVGHVFPMVPLARALRDAGHEVLWVTGAESVSWVESAGIPAVAGGFSDSQRADATRDLLSVAAALPGTERAAFLFPGMFAAILAPAMLPDLLAVARDFRPTLLVHEHAELAAPLVAALVDAPSVTHAFGGAVPAAFVAGAAERLAPLWDEHGLEGAGLPQVCVPKAADQFRNAQGATARGAGISLPPLEATGEAIAEAVRAALTDDSIRTAAAEVAAEIAAMPSPDHVVATLTRVQR
jgi:hypothetical protein